MYGNYSIAEFDISNDFVEMKIEKRGGFLTYTRNLKNVDTWDGLVERVEKVILADSGHVIVNPVEPVNLPKEITSYLMIEFAKKVLVEPHGRKRVYVKFPVEVAVFVAGRKAVEVVDVFTLTKPKYTLYGDPRTGVVCRYWKSEVYPEIPKSDPFREGVMELNVVNEEREWVEIGKAVFNAIGMKIYYDSEMVCMKATMRVFSKLVAETDFFSKAVRDGMKKSLELYTARRIVVPTGKFVMEVGL